MNFNKKPFSKVKGSNVHKYKMHGGMIIDNVKEKKLCGDLNREEI